jgi:hypothetical protein
LCEYPTKFVMVCFTKLLQQQQDKGQRILSVRGNTKSGSDSVCDA